MVPFVVAFAGVGVLLAASAVCFIMAFLEGRPVREVGLKGARCIELGTYESQLARREEIVMRVLDDGEYTADELPDHHIVAWTPEEREAFGYNDTALFIESLDRELRRLELKCTGAEMPDLSSMRIPGLPPAEEPERVDFLAWGEINARAVIWGKINDGAIKTWHTPGAMPPF